MNLSTPLLIHILVEVIVFAIVFLYFQKKITQVYAHIREIQKHLMNQQNLLNKHEKILSELIGVRPHIQTDHFDFGAADPPPPAVPPSSPVQAPSVMPMMESIFSMLNTVASVATPPTAAPPNEIPPPQEPREKIDVESELEKELEELNDTRPDEGRVEEADKNDLNT